MQYVIFILQGKVKMAEIFFRVDPESLPNNTLLIPVVEGCNLFKYCH